MFKIFLHCREKEIQWVDVKPSTTVEAFGAEHVGPGAAVWREGGKDPLNSQSTLADVGIDEHCHVHVSVCKDVLVKVRFAGKSLECTVSPAETVEKIYKWATDSGEFKLTESERAKHELAVCETKRLPDVSEHVGSFANNTCAVCFDLRPKERFAGAARA